MSRLSIRESAFDRPVRTMYLTMNEYQYNLLHAPFHHQAKGINCTSK